MKRLLTLSFILLVSTLGAIAQKKVTDCAHKDLIREFVSLSDSLSRFFDKTKASVTDADWENFIRAAQNGEEEKALVHLGKLSEPVKTTLTDLASQLVAQKQKLFSAIKTDDKMTDPDVIDIINQEIQCYFNDKVENSLSKLIEATGKLAPPEIGTLGPCEQLDNCLRTANTAYNNALANCLGTATGGGGLFGWLGALFFGGGCAVTAASNFNIAAGGCIKKYYPACYGQH